MVSAQLQVIINHIILAKAWQHHLLSPLFFSLCLSPYRKIPLKKLTNIRTFSTLLDRPINSFTHFQSTGREPFHLFQLTMYPLQYQIYAIYHIFNINWKISFFCICSTFWKQVAEFTHSSKYSSQDAVLLCQLWLCHLETSVELLFGKSWDIYS